MDVIFDSEQHQKVEHNGVLYAIIKSEYPPDFSTVWANANNDDLFVCHIVVGGNIVQINQSGMRELFSFPKNELIIKGANFIGD